jgi:hypothetical protein
VLTTQGAKAHFRSGVSVRILGALLVEVSFAARVEAR